MPKVTAKIPMIGAWLVFGATIFVSVFLHSWVPLAVLASFIIAMVVIAAVCAGFARSSNYNIVIVNKDISDEDAIKLATRDEDSDSDNKTFN